MDFAVKVGLKMAWDTEFDFQVVCVAWHEVGFSRFFRCSCPAWCVLVYEQRKAWFNPAVVNSVASHPATINGVLYMLYNTMSQVSYALCKLLFIIEWDVFVYIMQVQFHIFKVQV